MYWPKFSQRKLMEKLKDRKRVSDSGCSCFYLQWTKDVGLKVFWSKGERTNTKRRQARAAKHRLGPRVGESVDFELPVLRDDWSEAPELSTIKLYGFFTEHVKILKRKRVTRRDVIALDCDLQKVGIFHNDLHGNNLAYRGKKLVCIDFGSESCESGTPEKNPSPHDRSLGSWGDTSERTGWDRI